MLFETKQGLQRQDLSEGAWKERTADLKPLSFWRTVYKAPIPTQEDAVKKNDAESELRRVLNLNDPSMDKLCNVLALLLERKRLLRLREKIQAETGKVLVYEHMETQETLLIREVDFKLADVEAIQQELAQSNSPVFGNAKVLQTEEAQETPIEA